MRGRLQQVDGVPGGPGRPVGHAGQRVGDGDRAAEVFVAENFFVQARPAGQRAAQPGQRGGAPAPDLGRAEHGQHGRGPLLPVRGAAEDVQPVADQRVLDLAQVAVHVQHEAVELLLAGRRGQLQVVVQFGGLDQFPDLGPQHGQLGRVEGADRGVLVEQLLQLGQVAVGVGAGHRRDQVVDDGGVPAPLGLGALARVVDDERVDQRQVAEHRVGRAAGGQAEALAGQPLQRAVLAQVHDGVRAEGGVQPAVGGQVVVRGRQVGVVVDGHRVLAEPARRLDHHDHVPEPQPGQHDVAVVGVQPAGRLAPVLPDGRLQRGGQGREPLLVVGLRHAQRRGRELGLGEPLGVLAARLDQLVDQRVPVLGEPLAQVVAGLAERLEQDHGRGGRVQPHGVADPGVPGRVGGQHDGEAFAVRRDVPQPGVRHRDPGHPGGPLRVRGVDTDAVRAGFLERERDRDQPAVELRHRHLHGRVHRGERRAGRRPGLAGRGQAQRLEHRDVQGGQRGHVPGVVIAARGRVGGHRPARGEHRDDDRVHAVQQVVELRRCGPQRAAEHGDRVGAGLLDGVGQRVHERGVPGHRVRAVEHDADGGAGGEAGPLAARAGVLAVGGEHLRGLEPFPGEQDRVGQEAGQLGQVGRAALPEVGEGLGGHPAGHRGQRHQLGVRGRLAAQHHRGQAAGQHRVEALGPAAAAAEQAHHHAERAVQQGRHVGGCGAGRVGQAPGGAVWLGLTGPGRPGPASRSVSEAEISTMPADGIIR